MVQWKMEGISNCRNTFQMQPFTIHLIKANTVDSESSLNNNQNITPKHVDESLSLPPPKKKNNITTKKQTNTTKKTSDLVCVTSRNFQLLDTKKLLQPTNQATLSTTAEAKPNKIATFTKNHHPWRWAVHHPSWCIHIVDTVDGVSIR